MRRKSLIIAILCLCSLVGCKLHKKEALSGGKVISAQVYQGVAHPASVATKGPATVKCIGTSGRATKCNIAAPGYSGDIDVDQEIGASGPGTVTLNCSSPSSYSSCTARVID
jgi:hypothetical protein